MKSIFLILVTVFIGGTAFAVQPARRPFVEIKIDGASVKTGDVLTITNGQKLKVDVESLGGRKDFCTFPETYAEDNSTIKVLYNGNKGITYEQNGKKAEWKLINEIFTLSGDENIQINKATNQSSAELSISNNKFTQSYLRISIRSIWQFSQDGLKKYEENIANGILFFTTTKSTDFWFFKSNIQASGSKNKSLEEKLFFVQDACDSIEHNMYHLNFQTVQLNIRKLQSAIGELKTVIDALKLNDPTFNCNVTFIGLPSDRPFNDIVLFNLVKNGWTTLESLLLEQKTSIDLLNNDPLIENKNVLSKQIANYSDWISKLPPVSFELLNKYLPSINVDSICLEPQITTFKDEQSSQAYQEVLTKYKAFVNYRIKKEPTENQEIATASSRIQAIRLFDGMLRSYFNSISWAEWINTRE